MQAKLIMTVNEMVDRNDWLNMRRKGIGGSDAGAIMGSNPWKSPYQLWLEKTGRAEPEDISEKPAVRWGTVLESPIADEFARQTGKRIRRAGMMQSVQDPWMLANVDRLILGERAGLEIKTTNAFSAKDWDDDKLPDSYYWQCQHYMMTTGLPVWYIAVLIGGQDFRWKAIPRNDEQIQELYEAERTFWNTHVLGDIPPELDGSSATGEALKEQFPGGKEGIVDLTVLGQPYLDMYYGFKEQVKELKDKQDEMQHKICALMGDYEVAMIGDKKVSWKTSKGRTTIDSKRLKSELPDIFAAYSKISKPSRTFRA